MVEPIKKYIISKVGKGNTIYRTAVASCVDAVGPNSTPTVSGGVHDKKLPLRAVDKEKNKGELVFGDAHSDGKLDWGTDSIACEERHAIEPDWVPDETLRSVFYSPCYLEPDKEHYKRLAATHESFISVFHTRFTQIFRQISLDITHGKKGISVQQDGQCVAITGANYFAKICGCSDSPEKVCYIVYKGALMDGVDVDVDLWELSVKLRTYGSEFDWFYEKHFTFSPER